MIIETIIVVGAAIYLGSLAFADRVLKRQAEEDTDPPDPPPPPRVWPYSHPSTNPSCPFCGTAVRGKGQENVDIRTYGVREVGIECRATGKCVVGAAPDSLPR